MKLSVAIARNGAPPSAFVVWRGFEESMRKAAELGYSGVELALETADDIDKSILSGLLCRYNLEVSCISTGQVFANRNLYFTHPDREIRKMVLNLFEELIDLAADFGRIINIGRVRGFIDKAGNKKETEELFIGMAAVICEKAYAKGVTIILEPVNRYEINFINNLDEGANLIKKAGLRNMGLMPDVFHMNIEDDNIGQSIVRNGELVKYIHLADSNRLAPGHGHINFDEVLGALKTVGFKGWASIEILPLPDPDSAAAAAARYMLPRIEKYNSLL